MTEEHMTATLDDVISMNARRYPSPDEDEIGHGYILLVVLKKMHGDFVTAYAGIVKDTSRTNSRYQEDAAPWIMAHGNRLPFEEAVLHFPIGLARETYYE